MKLQIKVPLMVIGILALIGIIAGAMMLFFQQKAGMRQFEHMALGLSGAVQASLEQGMLTGQRLHTQQTIARIIEEESLVTELTLFGPDSRMAASSEDSQLTTTGALNGLSQTLQSGKISVFSEWQNGLHELSVITPVLNRLECQVCHSPEAVVLGAVKVSLDAAFVDEQARQQTLFLGVVAGISFLMIGGGLAWTLRTTTLDRLSRLVGITEKISQGDYWIRSSENSSDEIGTLARAFNDMAARVGERSRELAEWNAKLESGIQERTREISALNLQLEEMNRIREQVLNRLMTAQEEERRLIARELHDDASQSLAAIALNLETIMDDLSPEYIEIRQRLSMLKQEAINTMEGVRELALELRPTILDDLGLARAVKSFARDYLGKRGIDFEVRVDGQDLKLPQHSETMLFRIAQEALTNIVKHAGASWVSIELVFTRTNVIMKVKDNGQGFNAAFVMSDEHLEGSLGIHSMSERSMLLGGKFNIESKIGSGTLISVEIPFEEGGIYHG